MARPASICACGSHAYALSSRNVVALVSPEDAHLFDTREWQTHPKGYIHSREGKLHRIIVDAPDGLLVDHINHDKADCRRENLRLVTDAQSVRNRKKLRRSRGPASPFIGVHKNGRKWIARIVMDGRRKSVGTYETQEEAARAYDAAAKQCVGEYANLNFGS